MRGGAVVAAEQHDVGAEDEGAQLARREVAGLGHDEPAVRHGEREARFVGLAAHDRPAAPVDERLRVARHREPGDGAAGVVLGDRHGCLPVASGVLEDTRRSGASPWTSSDVGPIRSTNGRSAATSTPYSSAAFEPEDAPVSSRGRP